MKALIILALGIWLGMSIAGNSFSMPFDGYALQNAGNQLGNALGGGVAALMLGVAALVALGVFGLVFVGTLAISFPIVLLFLVAGLFLLPALLPFLIVLLVMGIMLKIFAAMVCW